MQTTKSVSEALGQFDALGALSQDTGAADAWAKPVSSNRKPWWLQNGRPVVTDVASARDIRSLSELAFAFETWAPRLA
jgi:hypothetical protein